MTILCLSLLQIEPPSCMGFLVLAVTQGQPHSLSLVFGSDPQEGTSSEETG